MKKNCVVSFLLLLVLSLFAGCSSLNFNLGFLEGKSDSGSPTVKNETKVSSKSPEIVASEITALIDQSVDKINTGKWDEGITVAEAAYKTLKENEANIKKDAIANKNFVSVREKLFETLVEAYGYKNNVQGLNSDEKDKYIRTAREHLLILPSDPFKKLEFSRVLLDVGHVEQGLKLATEIYNSPAKNKEIIENYAWALYLSGKKAEAYNIYKGFYNQSETLTQLYHSAVVIEEYDKLLGLILYKGCEKAGNNLMVTEANVKNLSAQGSINSIIAKSQKAINRLLVGGFRIDSKFNMQSVDNIVKSIVKLTSV